VLRGIYPILSLEILVQVSKISFSAQQIEQGRNKKYITKVKFDKKPNRNIQKWYEKTIYHVKI
jgi:hypothetical protein